MVAPMTQSESITALAAAIAKAQASLQTAEKDGANPHFSSKFATLTEVWRVVRDAYAPQGLSIIQAPEVAEDGSVALTTTLLHETGEWMSATMPVRVAKDDPQGVGSGLTYARRYALAAMCGVVADDDDDGEAAMGRGAQTGKTQRAKPAPAAAQAAAPKPAPAAAKPGTIGEAGRETLQTLCKDAHGTGADPAVLAQMVKDYASAAGVKIADLSVEQGAELRDMIADAVRSAQESAGAAQREAA